MLFVQIMSGMPVPEQIVHFVDEILGAVRDVMPTEETRSFINVVHDYLTRKLKKETVDDIAAMKQMYTSLMKAIDSLIKFVQNQQPNTTDYKSILNNIVPVRLDRFYALPHKLSAFKFSPISVLFGGDLPSVKQFIAGQSLKDIIPPFTRKLLHYYNFFSIFLLQFQCMCLYSRKLFNNMYLLLIKYFKFSTVLYL